MALKQIDLTGKCGSCCSFKPIEDTANGECLQNPYNDSVVHDPKHPYWIVQRSRIKCRLYNAKPQTNADRIRAMSDEEMAEFLTHINPTNCQDCAFSCGWRCQPDRDDYSDFEKCKEGRKRWLKQPADMKETN